MLFRLVVNAALLYFGFLLTKTPYFPTQWPLMLGSFAMVVIAVNLFIGSKPKP